MDTVAVCDTEPVAIEGLRSLLESAEGLRVVATETCLAAWEAVRALEPTIVLVDRAFGIHAVMEWLRTGSSFGPTPYRKRRRCGSCRPARRE